MNVLDIPAVSLLRRLGTTLGRSYLDGSGALIIDVRTDWGINGSDEPYFAPGVVAVGEEAVLLIDGGGGVSFVRLADIAIRNGTPLIAVNNLSDIANAAGARGNLGLGSAATHPATDFATPADLAGFLASASNLSDIANAAGARGNLGLGSAATHPATDFATPADLASLAPRPLWSIVAVDVSFVSNVTLADILTVAVEANQTYEVRIIVHYEGPTTADIKIGFVVPVATTIRFGYRGLSTAATSTTSAQVNGETIVVNSLAMGCVGAGVGTFMEVNGLLVVGANAGNFKVQAAQSASDPTATIVYAKSSLKLTKVV